MPPTPLAETSLGTIAAALSPDLSYPSNTPAPFPPTPVLPPILDAFNRADEDPATGWTDFPAGSGMRVVSGKFAASAATGQNGAYFNTAMTGRDQEAYITISTLPGHAGSTVLYARNDPAGGGVVGNNYAVRHTVDTGGTDLIFISRHDAGVATTLAQFSKELAAGDSLGIVCIGSTIAAMAVISGVLTFIGSALDVNYDGTGNENKLAVTTFESTGPLARWSNFRGRTI